MKRIWLVTLFVIMPLILLFERMAYYAVRSLVMSRLTVDLGLSSSEAIAQYSSFSTMMWFAPLLGGLLAIGIGPRITASIGAGTSLLAYLLLALAPPQAVSAVLILWTIGLGLFKPSFFAFIGLELRDQPEARWGALFVLLIAAVNVAAFAAPLFSRNFGGGAASAGMIFGAALMFSACAMLLVTVLSAPAEQLNVSAPAGTIEVGIAVLLAAVLPAHVLFGLAQEIGYKAMLSGPSGAHDLGGLFTANLVSIIGVSMLVTLALLVVPDSQRIIIVATGAALVIVTLSVAPLLLAPNPGTAVLQQILSAPAEVVIYGLLLGRASVGTHPRLATVVIAVWQVATALSYWVGNKLNETAPRAASLALALLCLLVGAVLLILFRRTEQTLFPLRRPTGSVG